LRFQNNITLVWANQRNYFENSTACSKRTLKTCVATQLKIATQKTHYNIILVLEDYINIIRTTDNLDIKDLSGELEYQQS